MIWFVIHQPCIEAGQIRQDAMGTDFLDFSFRIEKSFGIKIERLDWDQLLLPTRSELSAGDLHEWVVGLCRQKGVKAPWSSWNRVRLTLAGITGKRPQAILRTTLIRRDLDFH